MFSDCVLLTINQRRDNMKCSIYVISTLVALSVASYTQARWTTLDYPGAIETRAHGIDGSNIVGYYEDASGSTHGFLYDGSNWTTLDYPGADGTAAHGIDGSNIVGYYGDYAGPILMTAHGFLYDGSNWTTLDNPESDSTVAHGIDGSNIVGYCGDPPWGTNCRGFLYDGSNWTRFSYPTAPGPIDTRAFGIDGDKIVGWWRYSQYPLPMHGFLYDYVGADWTPLSYSVAEMTCPYDIDGSNIVGYYEDTSGADHGFLYDGSNWTTLDYPEAVETQALGIDGSNIVGSYEDASGTIHGFLYDEPPIPDIKANGSDGPLYVPWGERVNLTISLDPGGKAGEPAEWWLMLLSFHGNFPLFTFEAPVFELPEISLGRLALHTGWHIFLFNLDDTPDSRFDLMWYDYVTVIVVTHGSQSEDWLPDFDALIHEKIEE